MAAVFVAGDCCKWLGHSYLKLGDSGKAASAFAQGCQVAEQCGNKRLQVGWQCHIGVASVYGFGSHDALQGGAAAAAAA